MEKIAERITLMICRYRPDITRQQADTMKYGFECIIGESTKITIYFIVFALLSLMGHYLVALIYFCILRVFAGGFHANTYLQCFIISFTVLSVGIIVGSQFGLPITVRIVFLVMDFILIWAFAPVDHPNKPIISSKRRERLKYLSIAVFLIMAGMVFLLEPGLSSTAVTTMSLEAILLPVGRIKNGKGREF